MDKVLSFIIPSYNSEPYLDKCITSFLCPEVLDKLDVIIVNDGSTDETVNIANKYCAMHPDSIRLISQENRGHGGALNTGCAAAVGKYLKVIDADDWVITENLPEFIARLEACDADAVLTPFHTVDMTTGAKEARTMPGWTAPVVQIAQIMENWHIFEDCCVFHGITYRTDFYHQKGNVLPEHVFYEDQEYNTIPFCSARKVAVFDLFIYQYMVGNAQQSVAFGTQAKRIGHVEAVIDSMMGYLNTDAAMTDQGRRYLQKKIASVCLIYLATACIYEPDKKKGRRAARDFVRKLQARMPEVYQRIRKKYAIYLAMSCLGISPETYQRMVRSRGYRQMKK